MGATVRVEHWDTAWSQSMSLYSDEITDNISNDNTTLNAMKKNLNLVTGSKEYIERLYWRHGRSTWMSQYDNVPTRQPDDVTVAIYPPRYIVTPISLSYTDEQENKSAAAAMDLLKNKTMHAMNTLSDAVNAQIWSAASGPKQMYGFQDIVQINPTSGIVAGIDQGVNTWWRNTYKAAGATDKFDDLDNDKIYKGFRVLNSVMNESEDGNAETTDMFTGLAIYGILEDIFSSTGYARTQLKDNEYKVGGNKMVYRSAMVHKDRDVPARRIYGHNRKFNRLYIPRSANMKKTPFADGGANGQLGKVSHLVCGIQLVNTNRRRAWVCEGNSWQ